MEVVPKRLTLILLREGTERILLGMKKRGFGAGASCVATSRFVSLPPSPSFKEGHCSPAACSRVYIEKCSGTLVGRSIHVEGAGQGQGCETPT